MFIKFLLCEGMYVEFCAVSESEKVFGTITHTFLTE